MSLNEPSFPKEMNFGKMETFSCIIMHFEVYSLRASKYSCGLQKRKVTEGNNASDKKSY